MDRLQFRVEVVVFPEMEKSTGSQGSTLAQKVEMPGKIIRTEYPEMFSKAKLRLSKDTIRKSMEDYFMVVEGRSVSGTILILISGNLY